jgi:ethanolamine ammonia-lyase large subunit
LNSRVVVFLGMVLILLVKQVTPGMRSILASWSGQKGAVQVQSTEYLYDSKQIIRAGLEDHFCGKLLGVPIGCDACYTNHAEADQNDMDNLIVLLGAAGCTYIMGVPGADDVMLNYQSTSYHDVRFVQTLLGLRPAPEFEAWLQRMQIIDRDGRLAREGERSLVMRSVLQLAEG